MAEFQEKFIAFIDILGFKQMVAKAEAGQGFSLPEITELVDLLGSSTKRNDFETYGPTCCPESPRIEKCIDFRLTQTSDCVIVSAEISPAGAINLISHCWGTVIRLLQKGVMCRGYISKGLIHHTETHFIGTGYQKLLEAEQQVSVFKRSADDLGTPFVEIDQTLCEYISGCDDCVKEMFSRMTKSDGESVAIFPFQLFSHSFTIGGFGAAFNPDEERQSNDNLRKSIIAFRDKVSALVDTANPKAVRKAEHYIGALNDQIRVCDKTDEMIDTLCTPFPADIMRRRD
jgi:hypothetical protein